MSNENVDRDEHTLFYTTTETPRLLERADGWVFVGYQNRPLGRAEKVKQMPFELRLEGQPFSGVSYFVDRLFWGYGRGLMFIQGAEPQHLVGPNYLLVRAVRSAPYDPCPHLRDVQLALITEAPKGMHLDQARSVLLQCS